VAAVFSTGALGCGYTVSLIPREPGLLLHSLAFPLLPRVLTPPTSHASRGTCAATQQAGSANGFIQKNYPFWGEELGKVWFQVGKFPNSHSSSMLMLSGNSWQVELAFQQPFRLQNRFKQPCNHNPNLSGKAWKRRSFTSILEYISKNCKGIQSSFERQATWDNIQGKATIT